MIPLPLPLHVPGALSLLSVHSYDVMGGPLPLPPYVSAYSCLKGDPPVMMALALVCAAVAVVRLWRVDGLVCG